MRLMHVYYYGSKEQIRDNKFDPAVLNQGYVPKWHNVYPIIRGSLLSVNFIKATAISSQELRRRDTITLS